MDSAAPVPETLPAVIRRSLARTRPDVLLERSGDAWTGTSSEQLLQRVERLACALRSSLSAGDRVALIAENSVDWVVADFAILFAGCVVVPIFPTQAADQVAFILTNADAKLIFVDTPQALDRLTALGIPLPRTVVFKAQGVAGLAAFETHGEDVRAQRPQWPSEFERALHPGALAILIYTSGTTGEPKGVMLSHDNLAFTAQSAFGRAFATITPGSDVLSILPFSHIYEHCILYGYLLARVRHHISHRPEALLRDLREVRPFVMTAVPRIFERLVAGIVSAARTRGRVRAKLVTWSLDAGRRFMRAKTAGKRVPRSLRLAWFLARVGVLQKIRPRLGLDRLQFFVSGSSPLHIDTAMTLRAMGIETVEGYGPTECSPVVTVNGSADNHYGTVGRPIPGVEVRLAEDDEILVRGRNVMLGYYEDAAATERAMRGGWYHTGDVGAIDAQGYLRVIDRKNELFKTSGGKFIAPARVESAIKRSIYIAQALVVGNARPHPAALISPNWDAVRGEFGIPAAVPAARIAARSDVADFLTGEVLKQTSDLAAFEQVRRVIILPQDLTVEHGDLAPTLKVKRRIVEERFASAIDAAYAAPPRTHSRRKGASILS